MKNVIYILVDALSYDNIGAREFRNSPTPFIDSLMQKSLSCTNMFSQAPYTEAAFISNVCGENTLDNGGYLLGLSKTNTIYPTIFKENGYKTLSSFSPYIYSKSYIKDVDQPYYTRIFSIAPLMLYRMEYYKDKYLSNTIIEKEYTICYELLKESLETWIEQLKAIKNKDESTIMIYDLINNLDVLDSTLECIENEYKLLINSDDNKYLEGIFKKWKEHALFNIVNLNITNKQSSEFKNRLTVRYKNDLDNIQGIQNKLSKKNVKPDIKYLMNLALYDEDGFKGAKKTLSTYIDRYSNNEIREMMNSGVEKEKITISAHRQLEYLSSKIIDLDKKDEKNFTFIHLEDFHLPSMSYSYDIDDEEVISEEMRIAIEYAKNIPDNYRGNVLADLSAQYIDFKLKKFFDVLSGSLKNDYTIVITADHGYPCNYNPPRPIIYNALYQENYHVPFILHSSKGENKVDNGLHSSLDIMPTLLEKSGIKYSGKYNENIVGDKAREYVLIEYPGPGCPDIAAKKMFYVVYDGNYKLGVKSYLKDIASKDDVVCIYNLNEDKDEKNNLVKKAIDSECISNLFEIVKRRHSEISNKFSGEKFIDFMVMKN